MLDLRRALQAAEEGAAMTDAFRCYCCGEALGPSFVLVSYNQDADRAFLMKPEHANRAEETYRLTVLAPGKKAAKLRAPRQSRKGESSNS